MISRIQQNSSVSFKGTELSPALKARIEAQTTMPNNTPEATLTDKIHNAKKGLAGFFKGINNVTNVGSGVARGLVEGGILAGIVGVVGKNIKLAEGNIGQTLKGIGSDAWKALSKTATALPKVITEAPINNAKSILKAAWNGTKAVLAGMKNHKLTAAIALGIGLIALAIRTVQGKIQANEKNADIDHKINLGHI